MTSEQSKEPRDHGLKALRAALINAYVTWRYLGGTVPNKEKSHV